MPAPLVSAGSLLQTSQVRLACGPRSRRPCWPAHPASPAQTTVDVLGEPTTLVVTSFANLVFVVVTQVDKLGTLVHVTQDQLPGARGPPNFTVKVLCGIHHDVSRRSSVCRGGECVGLLASDCTRARRGSFWSTCARDRSQRTSWRCGARPRPCWWPSRSAA